MLTIYVDADACPVKEEVYRVGRRYGMPVIIVANSPLRVPTDNLVQMVVRSAFGAADDWIAEQAGTEDIVVTADIPRQGGVMTGGPAPMALRDRSRFLSKLDELVNAVRRANPTSG